MSSTSYDLISINGTAIPDVEAGKGEVTVQDNPKYKEYETEDGGKVIEVIAEDKLKGVVSYSGLLQSAVQSVRNAISLVSTLTIYNPMQGQTKTFQALILPGAVTKLIHDEGANAWTFSFDFEEIGDAANNSSV